MKLEILVLMHWVKDGYEIQRCSFSANNIGEVAADALAERKFNHCV